MVDTSIQALKALETALAAQAESGTPKHECVFDVFAQAIRAGRLKPGQRLPAEAELCARLPVSLGTLQKAFTRLAASGLVARNRKTAPATVNAAV